MRQMLPWYLDGWDDDFDDFDDCEETTAMATADTQRRRDEAIKRRTLMKENYLATYFIPPGGTTIVCLCCGMSSANKGDIKTKYCSHCKSFHSETIERDPNDP